VIARAELASRTFLDADRVGGTVESGSAHNAFSLRSNTSHEGVSCGSTFSFHTVSAEFVEVASVGASARLGASVTNVASLALEGSSSLHSLLGTVEGRVTLGAVVSTLFTSEGVVGSQGAREARELGGAGRAIVSGFTGHWGDRS